MDAALSRIQRCRHTIVRPGAVGYAMVRDNEAFAQFLSSWIQSTNAGGFDRRLYDHWILGKTERRSGPRWSVLRDVLRWVD